MQLHTKIQGQGPPLVVLHGLFGSAENLGGIARALSDRFTVYGLDLRNHGRSPHGEAMDYPTLAGDVAETMTAHGLEAAALIGHSMGGKTAMQLALSASERVERLAVLDIAPVAYRGGHDTELEALLGLDLGRLERRADADAALRETLPNPAVRQFLLKNLVRTEQGFDWRIPLETIRAAYPAIAAAPSGEGPYTGPALFLRGGNSGYVPADSEGTIQRLFPRAGIETIAETAHWLHVEAAETVASILADFLQAPSPATR